MGEMIDEEKEAAEKSKEYEFLAIQFNDDMTDSIQKLFGKVPDDLFEKIILRSLTAVIAVMSICQERSLEKSCEFIDGISSDILNKIHILHESKKGKDNERNS